MALDNMGSGIMVIPINNMLPGDQGGRTGARRFIKTRDQSLKCDYPFF
jgi:hypothetical protein